MQLRYVKLKHYILKKHNDNRFLPVLDSNLQVEISGIKGETTNLKLLKIIKTFYKINQIIKKMFYSTFL